ncbi:MAG TPA: hypothetical protein PKA63_03490 [Oligoflexia bacterium]|nr:hypothetical protein [Oligoflexia bacterium]HMP47717.1 hypothetical protein [Oligoflexia bacterium]
MKFTRKKVRGIVKGRYLDGIKPSLWDKRVDGLDIVIDEDGETLCLYSTGDQSTPQPGWEILITGQRPDNPEYLEWTLYGVQKVT